MRIQHEAQHSAFGKYYLTRMAYAPSDEQQRLRDLMRLHSAVARRSKPMGEVLLRLRPMAGQEAFSRFLEGVR